MIDAAEIAARFGARTDETGLAPAAAALWRGARGEWDRAHAIVAAREGEPDCDRVHAWLHRVEGDGSNARTWYRRAGAAPATGPVAAEWRALAECMSGERPE